jgi:hypothetical protein
MDGMPWRAAGGPRADAGTGLGLPRAGGRPESPGAIGAEVDPARPENAPGPEIPCGAAPSADPNLSRTQAVALQAAPGGTLAPHRSDPAGLFNRTQSLLDAFEVGDPKARVLVVQGAPDDAGSGVFRYGSSLVYFHDGFVTDWSNGVPRLRVREWPALRVPSLDTFSVGSTRSDVVRAQGEPAAFTFLGYYYGSSAVFFEDDRVTGWSEGDTGLKAVGMPAMPSVDMGRLGYRLIQDPSPRLSAAE